MEHIIFEKKDGIAFITLNRPQVLNALNMEMLTELEEARRDIMNDEAVRVLILTGEGRAFAAGADIALQSEFGVKEGREYAKMGSELFRKLEKLEIPTIAAVNGFALGGGCELALSCDMIIASSQAKFGQPEVSLGITPGFSGTQRLPRRIGMAKAKELIFTGAMITAQEAERLGLANKVTEPEELMNTAVALAAQIIKNAPLAVKYAKAALDRGIQTDIDTGIAIENELFAICYATEDQKTGMKAFLNKTPAVFKGI